MCASQSTYENRNVFSLDLNTDNESSADISGFCAVIIQHKYVRYFVTFYKMYFFRLCFGPASGVCIMLIAHTVDSGETIVTGIVVVMMCLCAVLWSGYSHVGPSASLPRAQVPGNHAGNVHDPLLLRRTQPGLHR